MNEIFYVLTDSFHKSNFQNHADVLNILISVLQYEQPIISEFIFSNEDNNKNAVFKYIVQINSMAFTHINKLQIESFALALFNKYANISEFRSVIRDFLVNLKSFSGNDEELFQEEKRIQLEEARKIEEIRKQFIPGLQQVYNDHKIFSANNYIDN